MKKKHLSTNYLMKVVSMNL